MIALRHEFGHPRQRIERPLFFGGHFEEQTGKSAKPAFPVRSKVAVAAPLLNPEGKTGPVETSSKGGGKLGDSFSQVIQPRAVDVWSKQAASGLRMPDPPMNPDGGWLQTTDELSQFKKVTGLRVRIEADNIARPAWPICDELGILRRLNCRNLRSASRPKRSETSQLLRVAHQAEGTAPPRGRRR